MFFEPLCHGLKIIIFGNAVQSAALLIPENLRGDTRERKCGTIRVQSRPFAVQNQRNISAWHRNLNHLLQAQEAWTLRLVQKLCYAGAMLTGRKHGFGLAFCQPLKFKNGDRFHSQAL